MGAGKDAARRIVVFGAALVALAVFSAPASAATCDLTGSGPEGVTDTSLFQVPGATLKASMIFVDFPGHEAVGGEAAPHTTIGPALRDWAAEYIEEVSGGHTQLDLQMGTTWLHMEHPANQYSATTFASQRALIVEATQLADAAGFDFSGRQTVYVVTAPTGGALPNSPAFHAFSGEAIVRDGTAIRWGASMGDDVRHPIQDYGSKVLVHETGHTFGLPDLYRYGQPFASAHPDAGAWDLMGWVGPGLHLTGWHKRKLGWLDGGEWACVEGQATASLAPAASPGGMKMMVTRASPSVAYVAEVRGLIGKDAGMCDVGGVLVYRVDSNAPGGFAGGVAPIQVKRAQPNAPDDPEGTCAAISDAPFGVGPGETSQFTEGAVSIEVLSGSPAGGYSVRMTGPVLPNPPAKPATTGKRARALKKCKKVKKRKARKKCLRKARKQPV